MSVWKKWGEYLVSPQEEKEAREEKKEETQTYGLQKTSFAKMLEEFTKEDEEEEARKRERNRMEAEDRRVGRMGGAMVRQMGAARW